MKKLIVIITLLIVYVNNIYSQISLVNWPLTVNANPTINVQNINADNFIWEPSTSTIAYSTSYGAGIGAWNLNSVLDSNQYYQIAISPANSFKLNIDSIQFGERRSALCIRRFQVLYSLNANFSSPDTLMIDSFYVSNSTYSSLRNHSITGLNIKINSGDTLYIRFFGFYSISQSASTKWYIKNINIFGNVLPSNTNNLTSVAELSGTQLSSDTISSLRISPGNAKSVFKFKISDKGNGDNKPTNVTQIKIVNPNGTSWLNNIAGVILKDNSNTVITTGTATITDADITIPILSGNLVISDNSYKEITMYIYLQNNTVEDNAVLQFMIDSVNHGFIADTTGSGFASTFPAQIFSNSFTINVTATKLQPITNTPINTTVNTPFSISISATDTNSNIDINTPGSITLSVVSGGTGTLSSTSGLTKNFTNGICTWNDLKYDLVQTISIKATYSSTKQISDIFFTVNVQSASAPCLVDSFTNGIGNNWVSDNIDKFAIGSNLGNPVMHLYDGSALSSNTHYISSPVVNCSLNKTEWQFWVKLDWTTSLSSSNNLKVYLYSDISDLTQSQSAYYLLFDGGSGADKISLYKQNGGTAALLCTACSDSVGINDLKPVRIRVRKENNTNWTVSADFHGGTGFADIISAVDNSPILFPDTFYFGFLCKYSLMHWQDYYFDDVYIGPEIIDNTSPCINSITVNSSTCINLNLSEPVNTVSANNISNYILNGVTNPVSATFISSSNSVQLCFSSPFTEDFQNLIKVTNVADLSGNLIGSNCDTGAFSYHIIKPYDIEINEIMTDESPLPVGLPACDYIELYNRSNFDIDLNGWKLFFGTDDPLIFSSCIVPAKGYLIVTALDSINLYSGLVYGFSSFSINLDEVIFLKNPLDQIISYISFTTDWYNSSTKSGGGWSLEQIDPNNPCGESNNWSASCDPSGGTPGRINCVDEINSDADCPYPVRISVIDSLTIEVYFSESIDSVIASDKTIYTVSNYTGTLDTVLLVSPDYKSAILKFDTAFRRNTIYILTIADTITDCAGNILCANYNSCRFGLPEPVDSFDVVINEVLADPLTGGSDFIELYNRSNKILDLKNLYFSYLTSSSDTIETINCIQPSGYVIFPGEYVAITDNPDAVKTQYYTLNPNNFIIPSDMPSLSATSGRVKIINDSLRVIDDFSYTSSMHFPILTSTKGVSLERINFNRPTADVTNWHSAAWNVGYATPAYKNSEYIDMIENSDEIKVDPEVFSPDNDGHDDVINIYFKFNEPGWVANVKIFDSRGRLEKYLLKNVLIGTEGTFSWDGINDDNIKSTIGIYILYFELYDLDKKMKKIKKTFVLAGKLN